MSHPALGGPVPLRPRRAPRRSRRPGLRRAGVWRRLAGPALGWLLLAAAIGSPVFGALFLPTSAAERTLVRVPAGADAERIARLLESAGLLPRPSLFIASARLSGLGRHLQAGVYAFSGRTGVWPMLAAIQSGRIATVRIRIPEGAAAWQIADLLAAAGLVDYGRFLSLIVQPEMVFPGGVPVSVPDHSLEGYLFPDTYTFSYDQGEAAIIRTMVGRFKMQAEPILTSAANGLGPFDTLVLASMVEKEANRPAERPLVAGVFLNRLHAHMQLQSDPTVQYALRSPGLALSLRDLDYASPYNTYRTFGLPPGPIANPSAASLEAASHPDATPYFYFVAAGDGTHRFSRTYAEHLQEMRRLGY